jgi:hypothetical protein
MKSHEHLGRAVGGLFLDGGSVHVHGTELLMSSNVTGAPVTQVADVFR